MPYCYVLYSKTTDRFYIGSTILNPEERLRRHLIDYYGNNKFTSMVKDWEIFFVIECSTLVQARKIEQHLKRMKSKKYIRNLKNYPEIMVSLLKRYS